MSGLDDLLLPERSRIVHIGPHKTGTTAIQGAFADARDRLGAYGLHYPGQKWQVYRPALALTGSAGHRGTGEVDPREWANLVEEIRSYGDDRTLISSESLVHASADRIARLRDDLDPERVQIVRMIRRYDKVLPSIWQQHVVNGYDKPWPRYVGWPLNSPTAQFWQRFGFASLTRQWAEVVGPDRVTVVVVDESDRGWLLRVMERLTGLPDGFLKVGDHARYQNRSLSWAEAEMIRRANLEFNARGWSDAALRHYIRFGVKAALKPFETEHAEGRPQVSPGRYAQLEDITRRDWDELQALGVRVVGELDWLLPPRHDGPLPDVPTAADPSAQGPLLLSAPKVIAAVSIVAKRATLSHAPALGKAPDLRAPRPKAPAIGPARSADRRRWWRRAPARTVVRPPLDQALAAWEKHLAAGGSEDLIALLPSLSIQMPAADEVVIAHGSARSYDELHVVRELVLRRVGSAATLIEWLHGAEPEPSYGLPEDVRLWANQRAVEMRAAILRNGTKVDGDLEALDPPPSDSAEPQLPAARAGLLLAGMVAITQRVARL
jgi:hypothetical protein